MMIDEIQVTLAITQLFRNRKKLLQLDTIELFSVFEKFIIAICQL